jgi:hypothetical protein
MGSVEVATFTMNGTSWSAEACSDGTAARSSCVISRRRQEERNSSVSPCRIGISFAVGVVRRR